MRSSSRTSPGRGASSRLLARDAVHLAVMQRHGITRILSFDTGFDGIVGVERIGT